MLGGYPQVDLKRMSSTYSKKLFISDDPGVDFDVASSFVDRNALPASLKITFPVSGS
jgi:hypothetical protein